jgi:hypothetical protein
MKNPVRTGTMIALTAASLFASACGKADNRSSKPEASEAKPSAPDEKTAKLHCQGANDCKGQSGCKTAANACAGQNGCKGKGYIDVASEDECKAKGGTVMATM